MTPLERVALQGADNILLPPPLLTSLAISKPLIRVISQHIPVNEITKSK
jgi:hypothetical protein